MYFVAAAQADVVAVSSAIFAVAVRPQLLARALLSSCTSRAWSCEVADGSDDRACGATWSRD